jgi:hypothetical protein
VSASPHCAHHWRIMGTPTDSGYYARCRRCQAQTYFLTEPPSRDPPPEELRLRAQELNWDAWFRRVEWGSGEGVLGRLRRNKRLSRHVYGTRL